MLSEWKHTSYKWCWSILLSWTVPFLERIIYGAVNLHLRVDGPSRRKIYSFLHRWPVTCGKGVKFTPIKTMEESLFNFEQSESLSCVSGSCHLACVGFSIWLPWVSMIAVVCRLPCVEPISLCIAWAWGVLSWVPHYFNLISIHVPQFHLKTIILIEKNSTI